MVDEDSLLQDTEDRLAYRLLMLWQVRVTAAGLALRLLLNGGWSL